MRGIATLALVAAALAACGSGTAGTSASTELKIRYWETRQDDKPTVWTLRCNPARGTLPRPARACTRLAEGGRKLFAPVPRDVACTQIYGGPQSAIVSGVFRGDRVWARFSRSDGCQIARWNRLSPWLLPSARAS